MPAYGWLLTNGDGHDTSGYCITPETTNIKPGARWICVCGRAHLAYSNPGSTTVAWVYRPSDHDIALFTYLHGSRPPERLPTWDNR